MSENLFKRVITSIILLSLLFFVNFSHQIIFIIFILILGLIVCFETNKIFLKLISQHSSRANYKTGFVNNSTSSSINGLTVEQRQALTNALKPKADN